MIKTLIKPIVLDTNNMVDNLVDNIKVLNLNNGKEQEQKQNTFKNKFHDENESEDEEEQIIESVTCCFNDRGERGQYLAKGPMKRTTNNPAPCPYTKPMSGKILPSDLDEINFHSFLSQPFDGGEILELPDLDAINCFEDSFDNDSNTTSRIIVRNKNENTNFTVITTSMSFTIDEYNKKMGITVAKTSLPQETITENAKETSKMEIFIQLDSNISRIIKVIAKIEKVDNASQLEQQWVLKSQFFKLEPFSGRSSLEVLLDGIPQKELEAAAELLANKTKEDLLKKYDGDITVLMTLICQPESPAIRAQILMVTKELLSSTDPNVRRNIVNRNFLGSALDLAAVRNKADIAIFLSEVFFDMGEDLNYADMGNTVLHLLARKGDEVANTMQSLLNLRFHGDRKVYSTDKKNTNDEMPIHIASKNQKCHHRIIQLLSQDLPSCFTSPASDGSLPIHYACQYSSDPTLIATLLYYQGSVVNSKRKDGFTPLLLVAARSDIQDMDVKLIALDEASQIRMINILLEHGADKNISVEGHLPMSIVQPDRASVKQLLKLSRNSSPTLGSPVNGGYHNALDAEDEASRYFNGGQTIVNNLNSEVGLITSPAQSSGFGDMSPMTTISSTSGSPSRNNPVYPFQNSPLESGSTGIGGGDSGSDSDDGNNLDAIAGFLFQHPSIQMALNDSLNI